MITENLRVIASLVLFIDIIAMCWWLIGKLFPEMPNDHQDNPTPEDFQKLQDHFRKNELKDEKNANHPGE